MSSSDSQVGREISRAYDAVERIRSSIGGLHRHDFISRPSRMDFLPTMSETLGIELLIKRDDVPGLGLGGNKSRELEFFIGDALARGCDVFIAGGGAAQSNHAVQCAAAAKRAGLHAVMVLQQFREEQDNGNLLLTKLLADRVELVAQDDIDAAISVRGGTSGRMRELAEEYRSRGANPYVLTSSFHPLAAASYIECAIEVEDQIASLDRRPTFVYVTSAGATQVGLAIGFAAADSSVHLRGISYTKNGSDLADRMWNLAEETCDLLEVPNPLSGPADLINSECAGPGYGIPSVEGMDALLLAARDGGILVDPIYTAKGMAGLIRDVRTGVVPNGSRVVFVHTGGLGSLFAYSGEVLDSIAGHSS